MAFHVVGMLEAILRSKNRALARNAFCIYSYSTYIRSAAETVQILDFLALKLLS